jgi:hypothetical protein
MTADFGERRKRSEFPFGVAAGVLVVLLAGGLWYAWEQHGWVEEARHWTVQGPPCRQVSAEQFQAGVAGGPPLMADSFNGVQVARAFGHLSCADVHDGDGWGLATHTVCQFSSPTWMTVRAGGVQTWHQAAPGQPMTVTVNKGQAACVLGATEWPALKG